MGCLGNLLWFIFGGCISGLSWCLAGCFLMNLLVVFLKYEQKRTVAGAIKAMNCEMRKDLNEKIIRRKFETKR